MIRYFSIFFFGLMIVMNYLANALPLNKRTTGELSDSFPNLFVPAGITFSIWGVIYLLLLAYCIVQFKPANHETAMATGWLFTITCILNALWIVFWHYGKLPLSLLTMIGLLVTLIAINFQIKDLPSGWIKAAFGIYLGWICIATIANVTALLVHYGWGRWGIPEETWTIIMITAGALITTITLLDLRNPFIALSVIWAFAGIIIKRHTDYRSIVLAASAGIIIVIAGALYGLLKKI